MIHESTSIVALLHSERIRQFLFKTWRAPGQDPRVRVLFGVALAHAGMFPRSASQADRAAVTMRTGPLEDLSVPATRLARCHAALESLGATSLDLTDPRRVPLAAILAALPWPTESIEWVWGGALKTLRNSRRILDDGATTEQFAKQVSQVIGQYWRAVPARQSQSRLLHKNHEHLLSQPPLLLSLAATAPSIIGRPLPYKPGLDRGGWPPGASEERFRSSYIALLARQARPLANGGGVDRTTLVPPVRVVDTARAAIDNWPAGFERLHRRARHAYIRLRDQGAFSSEAARLRAARDAKDLVSILRRNPELKGWAEPWPRSIPPRSQVRLAAALRVFRQRAPAPLTESLRRFSRNVRTSAHAVWMANVVTRYAVAHKEKWLCLLDLTSALRLASRTSKHGVLTGRDRALGTSCGARLSPFVRHEGSPRRGFSISWNKNLHGMASPPLDLYVRIPVRGEDRIFVGSIRLYFVAPGPDAHWSSKELRTLRFAPKMSVLR